MLLVFRAQQKHMLLVLRAQQKHVLLVLRAKQIAQFPKKKKLCGAPPETLPNVKYDAPKDVYGDRKLFNRLLNK